MTCRSFPTMGLMITVSYKQCETNCLLLYIHYITITSPLHHYKYHSPRTLYIAIHCYITITSSQHHHCTSHVIITSSLHHHYIIITSPLHHHNITTASISQHIENCSTIENCCNFNIVVYCALAMSASRHNTTTLKKLTSTLTNRPTAIC